MRLRAVAAHLQASSSGGSALAAALVGRPAMNDDGTQHNKGERRIMAYGGLEGVHSFSRVERPEARAVEHLLQQNPRTGAVLPEELAGLKQRELVAAEAGEYRLAAQLRDIRNVLTPHHQPLTLADASPSALEDQYEFFLQNGFLSHRRLSH
jgi:hypothetical protein